MHIGIILPILIVFTFIIFNFIFAKYLKDNNIIEGLENNCNAQKDKLIYENSAAIKVVQTQVNDLTDKLLTVTSSLDNISNMNKMNADKISTIENKIKKAEEQAAKAQGQADDFNNKMKAMDQESNKTNPDDLIL